MYISDEIPSSFRYVVELSDNYVVLSDKSLLQSNNAYEVYIQYFNPSTMVINTDDYYIKESDSTYKTYNYIYDNNGVYSYVDSIEESFEVRPFSVEAYYDSLFNRPDHMNILVDVFLLLALVIVIVNLATSLIKNGGIFGNG